MSLEHVPPDARPPGLPPGAGRTVSLTAMICGRDAQASLEATLDSVDWVDQVLVLLDDRTTDNSRGIAEAWAARHPGVDTRIRLEPWRGFSGSKEHGATLARNDWILVVDADEEVSPRLRDQLRLLKSADWESFDLGYVRRRNWVLGRRVRAWWPDWQNRVWHRGRVTWGDEVLHDKRDAAEDRKRRFSGWLEHKRVGGDWTDYFSGDRQDARIGLVAEQMYGRGKRVGAIGLFCRPLGAFFKFYVLKRGFLDGAFGLLIAQKAAVSTQLKYAALWSVQNGHPPRSR